MITKTDEYNKYLEEKRRDERYNDEEVVEMKRNPIKNE
jgi:hypothetical protein